MSGPAKLVPLAPLPPRPPRQRVDRPGKSALSPGLIAVLARMTEAALDAEDALADGGNMRDHRDPAPGGPVGSADRRRHTAKEARR